MFSSNPTVTYYVYLCTLKLTTIYVMALQWNDMSLSIEMPNCIYIKLHICVQAEIRAPQYNSIYSKLNHPLKQIPTTTHKCRITWTQGIKQTEFHPYGLSNRKTTHIINTYQLYLWGKIVLKRLLTFQ